LQKKPIEVVIFNHKFTVKTDNDKAFVEQVATYVNEKIKEVKKMGKSVPTIDTVLLACMNIADEYLKFKEERGRMEGKVEKRIQDLIGLIDKELQ